ncbi:SUN domain-containing protein 2 [Clonorchis sinensis]|uniref:SUN domain-containing protein 2 n=1 Tax=Clonorchis sinensis TaxID=79923 RepID=G7YBZ6_CLOSI|nr:SUN domain-containing protein 2 [Clonorchis sinensis]
MVTKRLQANCQARRTDQQPPDQQPSSRAGQHIATLGSRTLNDSDLEMDSVVTDNRLSAVIPGLGGNREEELEDDELSSRASVASSRSSTRVSRVRCIRVQGEWCVHSECIASTPGNRRMILVAHQRNTNNTADVNHIIDGTETETPTGRHRHKQDQQQLVSRRSTRASLRPSITTTKTITSQNRIESNHHTDRSNQLASASSTYVYTFVWSSGTSSAGNKAQKWLARHIFGLESSAPVSTSNHFVPSDTEESDTIATGRSLARGKYVHTPSATRSRRLYHTDSSSTTWFFRPLVQGAEKLKGVTFSSIAFVLAGIFIVYDAFSSCVRNLSSAVWTFWFHPSSPLPHRSRDKLTVHPRLTQFDNHVTPEISSAEESDFFSRTFRASYTWFTRAGTICVRVLGCLCFLIPLLLLLAFLFAPVAVNDDEPPPVWPSFLSDADCKKALLESRPSDATVWQLARWRFRCLYYLYFLTPEFPSNTTTTSESSSVWQKFKTWLWPSTPVVPPPGILPTDLPSYVDGKLLAQLEAFRDFVNDRLDGLTNTIRRTEERVSEMEQRSDTQFNDLNIHINNLKQHFNEHTTALDSWHVQLQALQALAGRLDSSEPSKVTLNEYDRLFNAVINAANQTIVKELNLLRIELDEKSSSMWNRHNSSFTQLSLLISRLREELNDRLLQTEHRLGELRSQLNSGIHAQVVNHTSLVIQMEEIRLTLGNLSERLAQVRSANEGLDGLFMKLQEATRDCSERQLHQVEDCKQAAIQQAEIAVNAFSERFTNQISVLVKESLLHWLNDVSVEEALDSKLSELVKQSTREALDRTIRETAISGYAPSVDTSVAQTDELKSRVFVQKLIDAALERFAADRVGMADFALESAGGSIVGTRCTRTYTERAALFTIFGIPLARLSNSARTILQPSNNPGDCWAFHGSTGQAVIRLSAPIIITSVTLEHLPRVLSPNQRVDSAPKDFVIKGLSSETDEGVVIGTFVYDINGPAIQTFPIEGQSSSWHLIELGILSNHGHPLYTCVYRLRVHGRTPDP